MLKLSRLIKSFKYAGRGLLKIYKEEQNLQIQLIMAGLVFIFGIIMRIAYRDWAILSLAIALVLLMEIINSAIERVADALEPKISKYAKEIKDIMAGAVFLASIVAVLVGLFIFGPYIKQTI